jgi:hypothetical protein
MSLFGKSLCCGIIIWIIIKNYCCDIKFENVLKKCEKVLFCRGFYFYFYLFIIIIIIILIVIKKLLIWYKKCKKVIIFFKS